MKALIVDDEAHVRKAIKLLVPWDDYNINSILEGSDGFKAIEIIKKEKPELIFVDMMMPHMDGVKLLEWISAHQPYSKVIVISGYEDFNFMRHTIKYGAIDYILKPIDEEQLHESIKNAIKNWMQEESKRNQQRRYNIEFNRSKFVYWNKIFSAINDKSKLTPDILNRLEEHIGLNKYIEDCQVAIISTEIISKRIENKYDSNKYLLFFSLENIANEILGSSQSGYAFRNWNNNEVIIIIWDHLASCHSLITEIYNSLYKVYGEYFNIGIGSIKKFPKGIRDSYKEARSILNARNLLKKEGQIYIYAQTDLPKLQSLLFSQFELNILTAVRSNQTEKIKAAIEEWIAAVRKIQYITKKQLELWWNEYTIFKIRCIKEIWTEENVQSLQKTLGVDRFTIPIDKNGRFSTELWGNLLIEDLINFSHILTIHQHKEYNILYEIAEYIKEYYYKDITLSHLSKRFFLSNEYISRKFKHEFNENISVYIERIRIEKAKSLLLNRKNKVIHVSEMTGFKDEKYFSKVFKKATGIPPSEFRKINNI